MARGKGRKKGAPRGGHKAAPKRTGASSSASASLQQLQGAGATPIPLATATQFRKVLWQHTQTDQRLRQLHGLLTKLAAPQKQALLQKAFTIKPAEKANQQKKLQALFGLTNITISPLLYCLVNNLYEYAAINVSRQAMVCALARGTAVSGRPLKNSST